MNASQTSTKENFIKRYGEVDGSRKWEEYRAREAYAGNSLLYFIEKLGKEEGIKKYAEVKAAKEMNGRSYSIVSQDLFKKLDERLGDFAKESRQEKKNFEFELFINQDGVKKMKRVDYYLDGKIIEFNRDYWHANPRFYTEDDTIDKFSGQAQPVKEIWIYDKMRKEQIEKLGFKVLIIWEYDYNTDPEGTIQRCIDFLKSNPIDSL